MIVVFCRYTGFKKVWGGTSPLLNFLASPLGCTMAGQNILELGCGTGLAGLYAAHQGAHVLLTDVRAVTHLVQQNIDANSTPGSSTGHWEGAAVVGQGSAACMALDWTKDVLTQTNCAGQDLSMMKYVIAAEVIWLQELLQPFVDTLAFVLRQRCRPVCYMTYTRRGTASSKVFTSEAMVLQAMQSAGCSVEHIPEFDAVTGDQEDVLMWRVCAREPALS